MNLRLTQLILLSFCLAALAGCGGGSNTQPSNAGANVEDRSISRSEMENIDSAQSSGLDDDAAMSGSSLAADEDLLKVRVIYFDYDSASVRAEFRDVVEAHARYLELNPSASVTLEGHADERGTREYNIALGEQRALAVRKQLVLLGASAGQVRAVSFGEEKPIADGHDESAYSLNRRVEVVY